MMEIIFDAEHDPFLKSEKTASKNEIVSSHVALTKKR